MSVARVEAVADAVLFEGYSLYPYRQSSIKNMRRFNFGVVAPTSDRGTRGSGLQLADSHGMPGARGFPHDAVGYRPVSPAQSAAHRCPGRRSLARRSCPGDRGAGSPDRRPGRPSQRPRASHSRFDHLEGYVGVIGRTARRRGISAADSRGQYHFRECRRTARAQRHPAVCVRVDALDPLVEGRRVRLAAGASG